MDAISPDAENVRRALVAKGIETPMIDLTQCKDERRTAIASHMREVMKLIGLDLRSRVVAMSFCEPRSCK